MPAEILTLDERFFFRIALKNELITRADAEECIRVRHQLAKRGKAKTLQEIMLDNGLLTPEEVDQIHDAQNASQVVRLDSLYADIALRLHLATRANLEAAFTTQRERLYRVRVGEVLVDKGMLTAPQHRQVLVGLLGTLKAEEKEYIQALRLKKKLAGGPAPGAPGAAAADPGGEAARIRSAQTEVGGLAAAEETQPLPPGRSLVPPPHDRPPPLPSYGSTTPTVPLRRDPLHVPRPGGALPPPAPIPPPPKRPASQPMRPVAASIPPPPAPKPVSGLRPAPLPIERERPAPPPPPPPPTRQPQPVAEAIVDSEEMLTSSSDERVVPHAAPAAKRDADFQDWLGLDTIDKPEPPPRKAAAASARRPSSDDELPESFFASNVLAVREENRARAGPPPKRTASGRLPRQPPRRPGGKADPAKLLESAIETFEEHADEKAETGIVESDLLQIESDITNVDQLEDEGARTFSQLKVRRSSGEKGPIFSTDEYLRRRRRKALVARVAILAVLGFIVVPLAAGIWLAYGNQRAVAASREALRQGDFEAASLAAQDAGPFWIGDAALEGLRREIDFRRQLAPVEAERAARRWPEALEALGLVRDEFKDFAADVARIEADIAVAMHLDRGARAEADGDLATAVAAYEQARRLAQDRPEAGDKIAAIKRQIEADVAAAEASGDLERQIEAYRRFNAVFGGREREVEKRVLEYDLKKQLAEGDAAAEARDYDKALGHYYKASAAAKSLGRAEAVVEVEERTRSARKLGNFQSYFNKGQEHEAKGRYDDALQSYRGALTWLGKDDEERKALVDRRMVEAEKQKKIKAVDVEAERYWSEAMAALRKSQTDGAVAALEAHQKLKPGDKRVAEALAFARAVADMVYVPAGEFSYGSKAGAPLAEKDEMPERKLTTGAYFIDRYETRNKAYLAFVDDAGERRPEHWTVGGPPGRGGFAPEHADHPVVHVSFVEAAKFAGWAKKRLPTEAEWEKAARGADARTWPWGEQGEGVRANVGAKLSERLPIMTKPVGTSPGDVSPFGLYDMGGNVSEWTDSIYSAERKVIRGGSWRYGWPYARCANRDSANGAERFNEVGFRCVKDIPALLADELK